MNNVLSAEIILQIKNSITVVLFKFKAGELK